MGPVLADRGKDLCMWFLILSFLQLEFVMGGLILFGTRTIAGKTKSRHPVLKAGLLYFLALNFGLVGVYIAVQFKLLPMLLH